MKTTERNESVMPNGSWLAQERQRLGKTLADVAKAVHGHYATVRAVEQNNRVLPPGWHSSLRKLGMNIYLPLWPAQMQPYGGADLNADLQARTGFRHSRYWLSKQLCVSESIVTDIIRSNYLVPHSWLLKLAELGANVPAQVRRTLYLNSSDGYVLQSPAPPASKLAGAEGLRATDSVFEKWAQSLMAAPQASETFAPLRPASRPMESDEAKRAERSSLSEETNKPQAPVEVPERSSTQREQASVSMNWTEDSGLHFSISAPLLEKMPDVLKELLSRLTQSGLHVLTPGPSTPTART